MWLGDLCCLIQFAICHVDQDFVNRREVIAHIRHHVLLHHRRHLDQLPGILFCV
ncbi:hypothetical protein [Solemya velum gill symbiont]|uniref:hypothetical protein n=1 Tax=Solemya velum gill symbiont TaxID=2340 RepID=UPI0018A8397B|nr:hypothetical protein [Solemya velum gill symbiont]